MNAFQHLRNTRENEKMSCQANNKVTSFLECLHLHEDYLFAPVCMEDPADRISGDSSKEETQNSSNHPSDINQQVLNHLTAANSGSLIFNMILDALVENGTMTKEEEDSNGIPDDLRIDCEKAENQRLILCITNILQDRKTLNSMHIREIGSVLNMLIDNNMN